MISVVLACLLGVSNSASAAEQMDNGLWVDVYRIGNSRSGRMAIFFYAEERNGMMAICGNYYMWGGGSVHSRLERGLNQYRFFYNSRSLFSNASFLWRAPTEEQIGDEISCRVTDIPYVSNANDLLNGRMPRSR